MSDFDEMVGPSASERARQHAASQDAGEREVRAFEAGRERGREDAARAPVRSASRSRSTSAPGRVRIGYAAPSGDTGQAWKVLVLVEMVALYAAAVEVNRGDQPALAWIVGKDGMKRLSAVVAVLVLLVLLADVGLGLAAAIFGAIVLFSYLSTRGRPAIGRLAPH